MMSQNGWKRWLACCLLPLAFIGCSDPDGDGNGPGTGGPFGTGENIVVGVTPKPLVFSAVFVGKEATRNVVVRHDGKDGILKLSSIRLSDSSDPEFTLTTPIVTEMAPGEETIIQVTYRPLSADVHTGAIEIATNATSGGANETVLVPITTVIQSGSLKSFPSPYLDFGAVTQGGALTKTVTFSNGSSTPIAMESFSVYGSSVADFEIVDTPVLPGEIPPGDSITVDVTYTPSGVPSDEAELVLTHLVDGEETFHPHPMKGRAIVATLSAFPDPIDFGERPLDTAHTIKVSFSNQGEADLTVTAMEMAEWSSDTVAFTGFPAEGVTLATGEFAAIDVIFTPDAALLPTSNAIAGIVVESNDPKLGGTQVISVFGRPETAALQVNPPEVLEFGYVAQNLSTLRKVALFNAGNAALTVTAITLTNDSGGEYAIQANENWGPTSAVPTPGVLGPGEHREVRVVFTNNGADNGDAWGGLTIASDDPSQPVWALDLIAKRAGKPTCEVALVPDQLDYGIVPRGLTKSLKMKLVNTGSGNCSFHSAFVNDCAGWGGFFGTTCKDPNETIQQDGDSDYYQIIKAPLALQEGLKPGTTEEIEILFVPPDTAPIFGDEITDYAGFLGIRIIDPYEPVASGESPVKIIYPTANGAAGSYSANLHAKSGFADLSVFPQELEFGVVTIGCYSQTLNVSAYNVGTAPLDLTSWELIGCSPEFQIKTYPGLPKTLLPQEGVEFEVVYVPQDEGSDTCSLALTSSDADTPSAVVPLQGMGTFETEWTDEYIQTSGQNVDILFVIDDSGTMSEEQSNLSSNFAKFIAEAATWSNDYHVGVISTDTEGKGGQLQGSPRYITGTSGGSFQKNADLGTSGSGTEQGLLAAQLALSLPNAANSTVACTTDADCTAPEGCFDAFCGGKNRGFIRKDAALEIVFVSDEEDQSPADLAFYENFFKTIKGFYNSNLLHIHAIVGPAGGCSSSSGDASAGYKYMDLAAATGGNSVSICEPDFASGLKSIGEIAFGLKVQFFLTRSADPSTIDVTVNGSACAASTSGTTNWSYDVPSNSVVFNEFGACMPQPGEPVAIHYETICFLE